MELDPIKLAILAAIVPLVAQGIKMVVAAFKLPAPGRTVITIIAFLLSVIFSAVWVGKLPAWNGDPMAFSLELVKIAGAVFGLATLAYNIILAKLFEAMGLTAEFVASKVD